MNIKLWFFACLLCVSYSHGNRRTRHKTKYLNPNHVITNCRRYSNESSPESTTDVMLALDPAPTPKYTFLISEVSIDHPGIDDENAFIEIKSNVNSNMGRKATNILENHMLLILEGQPLSVTFTVNFNDRAVRVSVETLYIVIGTGPNTDILLTSPAVQNAKLENFKTFSRCNLFPCAVILLRNESKNLLNKLKLKSGGTLSYVPLNLETDTSLQNIIINSVEDLVVFGQSNNRVGFFDKLLQSKSTQEGSYLLRNFVNQPLAFTSLNYCSFEFKRFNVDHYKVGAISKKAHNICEGSFIVPNSQLITVRHSVPNPASQNPQTSGSNLIPAVVVWQNPYVEPTFQTSWLDDCKTSFPNSGRFLTFQSFQSFVSITVKDSKCHTMCHVCNSYFYRYEMRPDIKHRPNIVKHTGTFDANWSRYQQTITDHRAEQYHVDGARFLYDLSKSKSQTEYDEVIAKTFHAQEPIFQATINVIKSLYFVIKTNNPLAQHPRQIELLQHFGISVGTFQRNEVAAAKIADVISHEFHIKLLQSLVFRKVPFSLLADESTDVSNSGYIIILFQAIEDNFPVVYFYSLLVLSEGQTADGMFNVLKARLLEDEQLVPGFIDYFKTNIIALVNDGASSMVGIRHSWTTEINKFIQPRQVSVITCIAHRLQLVMQSAIEIPSRTDARFAYFNKFEKTLNRFYTFYMSRGSKRWQHLQEIAEQLQLSKPKRIRYIFNIRWAASHYHALKNLQFDYQLIKYDLIAISLDNSFDKTAQQNAQELHDIIADKSFTIVLHELVDALTIFKELSLVFQESGGLLVGKSRVVNKAFKRFEDLKFEVGPHVTNFLKECSCKNGCTKPDCTIQNYDDCKDIEYNGNLLEKLDSTGIRLSNARRFLYESFIAELKKRFSFEILQGMELFDPQKINYLTLNSLGQVPPPAPVGSLNMYYIQDDDDDVLFPEVSNDRKIEIVCQFYFIDQNDCEILAIEWLNLIRSITRNAFLITEKIVRPDLFWPAALSESTLIWSQLTRRVIYTVLATGNNNAESERGFSLMAATKTKSRSNTGPRLLENYLRIRLNGPDNINDFNALYYTAKFLKHHALADSTEALGGREAAAEKFPSFFKHSRIFN